MEPCQQVFDCITSILSDLLEKPQEELAANPDADFIKDYQMTSLHIFPLISRLEDRLDIALDYSEFINRGNSINSTVEFVLPVVEKNNQ